MRAHVVLHVAELRELAVASSALQELVHPESLLVHDLDLAEAFLFANHQVTSFTSGHWSLSLRDIK